MGSGGDCEASLNQTEGFTMYGKRVMVVVDETAHSKNAMIWSLTHVVNKAGLLTLLHIVPPHHASESSSSYLANYLGSLCKDCKPQVCFSIIWVLDFNFHVLFSIF